MRPAARRHLVVAWFTFVAAFVTGAFARELVQPPTAVALTIAAGVLAHLVASWRIPPATAPAPARKETETLRGSPGSPRTNGSPRKLGAYPVQRPGGDS